jgi:dephospho-CoA kinase
LKAVKERKMKTIGLTGGIASGKSLVGDILGRLGAVVIDADQLAREVVRPGTSCYEAVKREFGAAILRQDGSIDRPALGRIVFADRAARKRLEAITHPEILRIGRERLKQERERGTPFTVYMVPLLFEAGLESEVDLVWTVFVDEESQVGRLMKRDGIGREEALRKIRAQMSMEEKMRRSDVVIDNSGSIEDTMRRVTEEWEKLREPVHTKEPSRGERSP